MNHIGNPGWREAWCGAVSVSTFDLCSIDLTPGWCPECCRMLLLGTVPEERVDALFRVGLHQLCEGVVGSLSGSYDSADPADFWEMIDYLSYRVMTWRPSYLSACAEYDQATLNRVLATLEIVDVTWRDRAPPRPVARSVGESATSASLNA